jgi:hypothetical protein
MIQFWKIIYLSKLCFEWLKFFMAIYAPTFQASIFYKEGFLVVFYVLLNFFVCHVETFQIMVCPILGLLSLKTPTCS